MNQPSAILWQEWGKTAFDQARSEGRLILLYISASWCHWCHVMEDDTLSHPEVARQVASHYLPIRIDSDKRPDINQRYNMGGWPTLAILTPEGEVLAGETYLPAGATLQMLNQVYKEYKDEPAPKRPQIASRGKPRETHSGSRRFSEETCREVVGYLEESLKRNFDPEFGGFRGSMKFPMPGALDLVFHLYRRTGKADWLRMATTTLDGMRDGAIHDLEDGGFFRYSVSPDWAQPHYEKMLETQAQLLGSYLTGYQVTSDIRYRVTAEDILRYVNTWLWVDQGPWFGGSQAADPEYYQSVEDEREELTPPPVDQTLYTQLNAMMIQSLLKASVLLEVPDYMEQGLKVLAVLTQRCVNDQKSVHHYFFNGKASSFGFLPDHTWMMIALLEAYETVGEERYLEEAHGILQTTIARYWDSSLECFCDRSARSDDPGLLSHPMYPLDENVRMVLVLLKMSVLVGREEYRERATTILSFFSDRYKAHRLYAAPYAVAVDALSRPPMVITIVASFSDPDRIAFGRAAARLLDSWKIIEHLDLEIDAHRIEARGYPVSGKAVAFICIGRSCLPPIDFPEKLGKIAEQHLSNLHQERVTNE